MQLLRRQIRLHVLLFSPLLCLGVQRTKSPPVMHLIYSTINVQYTGESSSPASSQSTILLSVCLPMLQHMSELSRLSIRLRDASRLHTSIYMLISGLFVVAKLDINSQPRG